VNNVLQMLLQGYEPSNITIGEWLDTWLMEYKQPSVRVKTFEGYEYLIRLSRVFGVERAKKTENRSLRVKR
jgi:hypothetical protein